MNPVTTTGTACNDESGRVEGEGKQDSVKLMMTPLRWVTGGGDHEKVTCLSPMTVSNISGAPDGAEYDIIIDLPHRMFYYRCDLPASNISQEASLVTVLISMILILALQVYSLLSDIIRGLKWSCRLVPEEEVAMTVAPSCLVHCIVGSTTR